MVRSFSSRRGAGEVREVGVARQERQRDERLEAAGVVLEVAQLGHVVHLLLGRLEVPEQQRRVGAQPLAVRLAVDGEPRLRRHLAVGDDLADARAEHLGAAAGHGVVPGGAQPPERLGVVHLRDAGDEVDLDRGERRQRDVRQRGLELGEELLVVREVVLLRHAADDVELGDAELGELDGAVHELVDAVRVGALVLLGPHGERAEPAPDDADVGRVEVRVDVVGDRRRRSGAAPPRRPPRRAPRAGRPGRGPPPPRG